MIEAQRGVERAPQAALFFGNLHSFSASGFVQFTA